MIRNRFSHHWNVVRPWSLAIVIAVGASAQALTLGQAEEEGPLAGRAPAVEVIEGFQASLYADDDLAHDIQSMTIDSQGRVVVSGPGYVRILIDRDQDGKADSFEPFADGPATGAQGLHFDGSDLICTGDAGLIRYTDANRDDRADGPAETLLRLKTGGEHHAHSVQRGPDGWWYVVVGNLAGLSESFATSATSPIKKPVAGAILRLRPDFSGTEVHADGFRNPYDFAFSRQGDILVFDSDGEREVTLPWYQPTRVFLALAGSNAGWVSPTWKRPNYFPDMAPVVAELGRGSPTGVVTYQHPAFPAEYDNALFVADWTFGRVCVVPLEASGSAYRGEPREFMKGTGNSGFAPTDLAVGPDGALYVSVGGRGTRGGVFRVSTAEPRETPAAAPASADERLAFCLEAPQPLSSWSRARWLPVARELSRDPFLQAAQNTKLSPASRQRAIEILTELFGGLDPERIRALSADESRDVRARVAWSVGRVGLALKDPDSLQHLIRDDDPLVARCCLEAFVSAKPETRLAPHFEILIKHSRSQDKFVMQSAARVFARLAGRDREWFEIDYEIIDGKTWPLIGRRRVLGDLGLSRLQTRRQAEERLYFVRQAQLLLGDVGPGEPSTPELFDGYARPNHRDFPHPEIDLARRRIAEVYPTGQTEVDWELARLIAMVQPPSSELLDRVLAKITHFTHPTSDVHHLIVAARIPTPRNDDQRERIVEALLGLEPKAQELKLHLDTQWDPRIKELYGELVRLDFKLPSQLLRHPAFGHLGHVKFASKLSDDELQVATQALLGKLASDKQSGWTNDLVFLLGKSKTPEHLDLLREQSDNYAVRNSVLTVLAKRPGAVDRERFLRGLEAAQPEVVLTCLEALEKLPASQEGTEQVALVRALRRFTGDRSEYGLRDRVARLLQRNTGQDFGFEFGKAGYEPQLDAVAHWVAWVADKYPQQFESTTGPTFDLEQLQTQLEPVAWNEGNASRGASLFQNRACGQCHNRRSSLGPDLTGVATRLSREDLFAAIALPNRDVAPRYQTTMISTTGGKIHTGLVIYESIDGITLLDGTNQMIRLPATEIEDQRPVNVSLMPEGLLKNLGPGDLADLYAYLAQLKR